MDAKKSETAKAPAKNSKQDWFEFDSNLRSKPEVMRIRRITKEEVRTIVGSLGMLWSIVDQHGDLLDESDRPSERPDLDGIIPDYTVDDLIDQVGGDRAFWDAVIETGWLAESEFGLLIPGFERRFSTNSKRRSSASRRKMRQRMRDKGVIGTTPKPAQLPLPLEDAEVSREPVTFVTPKRDNRTVQDSTEQTPPPTPASEPECDRPGRREEEEVLEMDPEPPQAAAVDRQSLGQRIKAQRVHKPGMLDAALRVISAEHLSRVLAFAEEHRPIETPDGTLWAFPAGVVGNRITQPERATLPPNEGWPDPDRDWAIADRRRREKEDRERREALEIATRLAAERARLEGDAAEKLRERRWASELAEWGREEHRPELAEWLRGSGLPFAEQLAESALKKGLTSAGVRRAVMSLLERVQEGAGV